MRCVVGTLWDLVVLKGNQEARKMQGKSIVCVTEVNCVGGNLSTFVED